mmetsp:Transcript_17308/g.45830  ORF Transcript_17308/g.45830 Transcript_17308/m.45830 type:complete len:474 (+) Transcript_17308:987-2408(+)
MHELVVAALKERRVDGAEGLEAAGRQARREGHRMLLGNADIEGALGPEALLEDAYAGATGHRGRDGHDLVVLLRLPHKCISEHLGQGVVGRLGGLGGGRLGEVELRAHGVQLVAGLLRRQVALALLRLDVEQDRLVQGAILVLSLDVVEDLHQGVHVVPIDRTHVVEAKLFEELALAARTGAAERHRLHKVASVLIDLRSSLGKLSWQHGLGRRLQGLASRLEALGGLDFRNVVLEAQADRGLRERLGQGADGRVHRVVEGRQGHLAVVIQDDNAFAPDAACVIQGLPSHAAGDSAIADHRNAVALLALPVASHLEAHRGADGSGGVPSPEGVVLRLRALREAGKAAALTQRVDAAAALSEDLVGLALVRDVPADLVPGCVEDVVESYCEITHTQASAEVTATHGDGIKNLPAHLLRQVLELRHAHALHAGGALVAQGVKQRRGARREGALGDRSSRTLLFRASTVEAGDAAC